MLVEAALNETELLHRPMRQLEKYGDIQGERYSEYKNFFLINEGTIFIDDKEYHNLDVTI